MTDDHRFASLRGACRKWLRPEDDELDEDFGRELDPSYEESRFGEAELDGWSPMWPRRRALARLEDVIGR
ncbi:MAG: hypothetical protein AB7S26_31520 [Sandaracinaceae bacterium]